MNLAMLEPLQGKAGAHRFWEKYLSVFGVQRFRTYYDSAAFLLQGAKHA